MDDLRRLEAKQLARAKSRSRRRRVSIIRRRTVRASFALFAILWAIIFGRLATGNDPALSNNRSSSAKSQGPAATGAPSPTGLEESTPEVESVEPEPELEVVREPEVEFVEPEPEPEPIITASS